mmetsp:Transcript_6605/g.10045  ORF Transcript_6605/g.10045 Transcript_6605/m.10045 type:complete len:148 (-) Transcript_6605:107-550(-)
MRTQSVVCIYTIESTYLEELLDKKTVYDIYCYFRDSDAGARMTSPSRNPGNSVISFATPSEYFFTSLSSHGNATASLGQIYAFMITSLVFCTSSQASFTPARLSNKFCSYIENENGNRTEETGNLAPASIGPLGSFADTAVRTRMSL